MSKTKEELLELKEEYETLNNKLKELTEDELKMVVGGGSPSFVRESVVNTYKKDIESSFYFNLKIFGENEEGLDLIENQLLSRIEDLSLKKIINYEEKSLLCEFAKSLIINYRANNL